MCVFASGFLFFFFFFFFTAETKFTQLLDGSEHIELTQPHTHTRARAGITFTDTTPEYFFLRRHNKSSDQSSLQILLKVETLWQFIDHFEISNPHCSLWTETSVTQQPPCCVSFHPVSLTSACERCETGQCRLVWQLQGPSRKAYAQVFLAFVPPPLISWQKNADLAPGNDTGTSVQLFAA